MEFRGDNYGIEMYIDGVIDIGGVAAGHGDGHRQTGVLAILQHKSIPLRQPVLTEIQPPETIFSIWIGTCQVDDRIGPRLFQCCL